MRQRQRSVRERDARARIASAVVRRRRRRGAGASRGSSGRPRRRAHRSVSHRAQPRPRRHGRGLPRGARRRAIQATGGDQAGATRPAVAQCSGSAEARAPDPRDARPSEHRAAVRRRHDHGRHAVHRHGVCRRRADRHLLRFALAQRGAAAAAVPDRLLGGAPRAPEPHRPPRPQAVEHPRGARRRAQAARLRHRQDARRPPDDAHDGGDAGRLPRAHAGPRQPGTDSRRSDHDGERHVRARRRAVRVAVRLQAVRVEGQPPRRPGTLDLRRDCRRRPASSYKRGRTPPASRDNAARLRHGCDASWPAISTTSC